MGKHLTPTQKRLMLEAVEKRHVFVTTVRIRRHQLEPQCRVNQYEADQLKALEAMGKLKIIREIVRGLHTTIVATLPGHAAALS